MDSSDAHSAGQLQRPTVVYRLSPAKNGIPLRKCELETNRSGQSLPKKRYLVSQKSGKVYEIVDKSQVNGLSVRLEIPEPDTDLISDDQYFKYLNLIGTKRLTNDSKSTLRLWSLRNISKVQTLVKSDANGNVICPNVCPKPEVSSISLNCLSL